MLTIRLVTILLVFLSLLAFQPTPSRTSIVNRAGLPLEDPLPDFPPGATVIFDGSGDSRCSSLRIEAHWQCEQR